jgi:hypothetical protein
MSNQLQNGIDTGRREEDSVPERIAVDVDEVFERLYDRIRCLASRVRWSGTNPTLNPTALAHEAYLKLRRDPPDLASKSYEEVIGILRMQCIKFCWMRRGARALESVCL